MFIFGGLNSDGKPGPVDELYCLKTQGDAFEVSWNYFKRQNNILQKKASERDIPHYYFILFYGISSTQQNSKLHFY